jgi:hypothetical protein
VPRRNHALAYEGFMVIAAAASRRAAEKLGGCEWEGEEGEEGEEEGRGERNKRLRLAWS